MNALDCFTRIIFILLTVLTAVRAAATVQLTQFSNELPAGSPVRLTCTVKREIGVAAVGSDVTVNWYASKVGNWNDIKLNSILAKNVTFLSDAVFGQDKFGREAFKFNKAVDKPDELQIEVVILHPVPGDYEWRCEIDGPISASSKFTVGNSRINTRNNANEFIKCDGVEALRSQSKDVEVKWTKTVNGKVEIITPDDQAIGQDNTTVPDDKLVLTGIGPQDEANYTCSYSVANKTEDSFITELYVFTKPDPPSQPELSASSFLTLSIKWTPSRVRLTQTNKVENYEIQYISKDFYELNGARWPNTTDYGLMSRHVVQSPYNITSLISSTEYYIRIGAANNYGEVFSSTSLFKTNETVPKLPHIKPLKIRTTNTTIMWKDYVDAEIEITAYLLELRIRNDSGAYDEIDNYTVNNTVNEGDYDFTFTDLTKRTKYCFTIQAINDVGPSEKSDCRKFETDLEAPGEPKIVTAKQVERRNDTGTLLIEFEPPTCIQQQKKCADYYKLRYRLENSSEWWEQVIDDSEKTRKKRNAMNKKYELNGLELGRKYELELAAVVKSLYYDRLTNAVVYSSQYSKTYITEQLQTSTSIKPEVTQSATTKEPEEDKGVITIVAVVVPLAFLLILMIIIIPIMLKKRKASQDLNIDQNDDYWIDLNTPLLSSPSQGYVENDYENIGIEQWAEHVRNMHADSDIKFSEEYEQLSKTLPSDITNKESLEPANLDKNRYSNVVAYDHSRVPLKTLRTGDMKTDYINANYVDSYDRQRAFIATQGPLPDTIEDFWRMVWEQNCHVIVMITNVYEKHKKKCEQYWPNGGEVTYGRLAVELIDTKETAFWTIRKLKLKSNKASTKKKHHVEREITQFHFTDWPDHGVPVYTLPVLSFVKRACDANPITSGPITVHCSAGVGRTGTFIALESMMKQIMQKRTVNVHGFVRHIRSLRNLMVQTEAQYIFIHDALVHFIEGGGRSVEIPIKKIRMSLEELECKFDSSGETHLTKQFKSITKEQPEEKLTAYAKTDTLKVKNRSEAFVPLDNATRVKMPRIPGVAGSDYINATYLHGYFQNQEFIITQHPSTHTEFDFWRMVWDQNSMTIVMLSNMGEEDMITFYRPKGEPTMYDNKATFKLKFTEENLSNMDYAERTFLLESNQDDYEMETRMFAITCWPEAYEDGDGEGVFQFIIDVDEWHRSKRNQAGPIIVIDKHGGKLAAQFCALYTLYNQYKNDDVIDIYSLAALYHKKRPGVWQTADDYRFLYTSIVRLCEKVKFDNGGLDRRSESLDPIKDGAPVFAGVRRINTIPRSPERGSKIEDL